MSPADAWSLSWGCHVAGVPLLVAALAGQSAFGDAAGRLWAPAAADARVALVPLLAARGLAPLAEGAGAADWGAWASAIAAGLPDRGTPAGIAGRLGLAAGGLLVAADVQAALLAAGAPPTDAHEPLARHGATLGALRDDPLLPRHLRDRVAELVDLAAPAGDVATALAAAARIRRIGAAITSSWGATRVPERVGVYRDLPHTGPGPGAPTLAASRRPAGPEDEGAIVAFLRACPLWIASPGRIRAPWDPRVSVGTGSVHTDGVFAWTDDLASYVARWHVALPERFLAHGRETGWTAPAHVDLARLQYPSAIRR